MGVQCTLYTVHCTLYTVQCTPLTIISSIQRILPSVHPLLYSCVHRQCYRLRTIDRREFTSAKLDPPLQVYVIESLLRAILGI